MTPTASPWRPRRPVCQMVGTLGTGAGTTARGWLRYRIQEIAAITSRVIDADPQTEWQRERSRIVDGHTVVALLDRDG